MFQLTRKEFDALRSQFVISKGRGGRRHLPYACPTIHEITPTKFLLVLLHVFSWIVPSLILHRVSSERSLSLPRFSESFHTFAQFSEQITFGDTFRFGFD